MNKLFGTDGIRGIAGEFLSCDLALSVGAALGKILLETSASPRIVVGTDTRESGDILKAAISEGLSLSGCKVYDVGVVPTPAIAYLTAESSFDAGVMISASHNPYEYNGIKIFGSKGFKLSDDDEERIERLISEGNIKEFSGDTQTLIPASDLKAQYISHLKSFISRDFSGIHAVIDCANGAAAATVKEVLSDTGIVADFIGCEPNGKNINDACGSTHPEALREAVLAKGADIGLAFDGDADRVLAVNELGEETDGDFIMAILALSLKEKGELLKNTVVGTVMSNFGFSKFCEDNEIKFVGAKVGDRYVLEQIEKNGYSFGGEQSGHIILRKAATTGDGQLTAIHLLNAMKEGQKKLSSLSSVMNKYPQHLVNVYADAEDKATFQTSEKIAAVIANAEKRLKGIGRILVRPSGTEPLVRIMVESTDERLTVDLCEEVAESIKKILTGKET